MLTKAEVEAMPPNDVSRETLARLDKVESALNDEDGLRIRTRLLLEWTKSHELIDKERHDTLLGAIQKLSDRLEDQDDGSEEERRESRKEARLARRDFLVYVVAPVLGALGLGAVGYGTGTYFPPHEISDALADHSPIPVPRSPPAQPSPSFPQGEVSE